MINTNVAEEFHLYPSCPKDGPQLAASPGSLLTMRNHSSTPDLISQDLHFRKSSRWFWSMLKFEKHRSSALTDTTHFPQSQTALRNFFLISYHQAFWSSMLVRHPLLFQVKELNHSANKYLWWAHSAKCLHGRKDVYVKITVFIPWLFLLQTPNAFKQYGSQTPFPFFFSSSKLSK